MNNVNYLKLKNAIPMLYCCWRGKKLSMFGLLLAISGQGSCNYIWWP